MVSQWTINGRFLSQPLTGVQRHARQILTEMDALLAGNADLRDRFEVELLLPPDAVTPPPLKVIGVRRAGPFTGHLWEQLTLPFQARGWLLSLCNTGPVLRSRQIVCIHDLNTRLAPESYTAVFRLVYRLLIPLLARHAAQIVTVSHHSAALMQEHGIGAGRTITVIPNGHEHALAWTPRHTEETMAAAGPRTIVLLGSTAPHKNIGLILGMADRLAREGFRIAVAGGADPKVFARDLAASLPDNVIALGRIGDEALAALLRDSLCLAFPSRVEGFGLPPLEAMALGCPVVSSNSTSLPEVCGTAALYADPDDADAWIAAFRRLRDEPDLRQFLRELGIERARSFSWRGAARRYLELMAATASAPAPSAAGEPVQIA